MQARGDPRPPAGHPALRDALKKPWTFRSSSFTNDLVPGEIRTSLETRPEPSVLSHELLNSAVYTFLDVRPSRSVAPGHLHATRTPRCAARTTSGAGSGGDPAGAPRRPGPWQAPRRDVRRAHGGGLHSRGTRASAWPLLLQELGRGPVSQTQRRWFSPRAPGRRSSVEFAPAASRSQPDNLACRKTSKCLRWKLGRILRGGSRRSELEWCDRRLLARIHR